MQYNKSKLLVTIPCLLILAPLSLLFKVSRMVAETGEDILDSLAFKLDEWASNR